ncbi:MAG: hypothetical protein KAQ98_05945 [Bacteriovoracaceae bacterium]|nr:hypothetical protein [Bacteriovoracaceae bacterium]
MRGITNFFILILLIVNFSCSRQEKEEKRSPSGIENDEKHVHLMHIDGVRPDVFKRLLESGQLPHFSFLASRGKISFNASTVDKSETMKVVPSYLASRLDTKVVGWWQFEKDKFAFRNFWLDPMEIVNYAVGLEFPVYPTIYDFLKMKNKRIAAGFTLHRRGVPFTDYTRAYYEGIMGVMSHKYYDQAHATMTNLRNLYVESAKDATSEIPTFSHSLLAAADEFGHLLGLTANGISPKGDVVEYCFKRRPKRKRKKDNVERVFLLIDENSEGDSKNVIFQNMTFDDGRIIEKRKAGHFTRIKYHNPSNDDDPWGKLEAVKFCINLPVMDFYTSPASNGKNTIGKKTRHVVNQHYVLATIVKDIELGHLFNTFRNIHFDCEANLSHCYKPDYGKGLKDYLKYGGGASSLFERTLFLITSDHGFVDSKWKTGKCKDKKACRKEGRKKGSINMSFISMLNKKFGLNTPSKKVEIKKGEFIGIDDGTQPMNLAFPHTIKEWQNKDDNDGIDVRSLTQNAMVWSNNFFNRINKTIKTAVGRKYWWMFFLKKMIVFPKLDSALEEYKPLALNVISKLYLRSFPDYLKQEQKYLESIYNKHIRFIYGGGARNNAEFFIPHKDKKTGNYDWSKRPTLDEILSYKPTINSSKTVVETLKDIDSVGLIFIRENNPLVRKNPYGKMTVRVFDRFGNYGTISIQKDSETKELMYGYNPSSKGDPLGYDELEKNKWHFGTYDEWNDRSIKHSHYYNNAVGGMGSYLYSKNPAIGDIVVMHSQGWNFGNNSAGHGGIHSGEKKIVMIVSGPGAGVGKLMSRAVYKANGKGVEKTEYEVHPSILDLAPTILNWLGYGKNALTKLSRTDEFREYLVEWKKNQHYDIMSNFHRMKDIQSLIEFSGLGEIDIKKFGPELSQLFKFIQLQNVSLPDPYMSHEDGNQLILQ